MAKSTATDILEELRNYDTPSITNVVATYPKNPLCLGLIIPGQRTGIPTNPSVVCIPN